MACLPPKRYSIKYGNNGSFAEINVLHIYSISINILSDSAVESGQCIKPHVMQFMMQVQDVIKELTPVLSWQWCRTVRFSECSVFELAICCILNLKQLSYHYPLVRLNC